jgi:PAS domain S-box-containing protein
MLAAARCAGHPGIRRRNTGSRHRAVTPEAAAMTPPVSLLVFLFVAIYLVSGTITLYFAIAGWRHRNIPISLPFTLLMASLTIWTYAYIFEILSPDLDTGLFFNNIEVPCMLVVPVAFLLLVLYFTRCERYVNLRTLPLFFAAPAVLCLMEFTNPLHHLYYPDFTPVIYDGTVIWLHGHGPFFWLAVAFTYLVSILALVLIISHLSATGGHHRRPILLMLIAAEVPLACNILSTFRISPLPALDFTPIAFMISGLILAFGLFRYLFTSVPVAYTQVIATMQDGVIVTNGSSRVIDLNPAAEQITGVPLRDAIGREIGEILPMLPEGLWGTNLPDEGRRAECRIAPGGRQPRYFDVIAMPLGEAGIGSEGGLFVLRDITERKQAELALAEANRKINLLSSITRHDIRNQLMGLKAYLLLSEEVGDDPRARADYLVKEQAIADTISRQIDFTKVYEDLGVKAPAWQRVDACIRMAIAELPLRGIRVEAGPAGLEVSADPLLEKVFYNLIDNALRYGGDTLSAITVSADTVPDGILALVFADNGAGIAAEDKALIFERGFGKNTGLGLFLSREILSITGITITEDGEPGHGARFEIRVPAGAWRYNGSRGDD